MKKDIFWNSIGTAAWSFLSLLLLIVVTRINGVLDSGSFSFAFAFALIMFTVISYGGRTYQVSDHKEVYSTNNYLTLRLITSICAIILTVFFITINGYDWQKSVLILLLVSQRIFDALADVFYGVLQKKNQLYISGKSLFLKSILSFIIFFIIDILTQNLLLSAISLPVVSLLFLVFYDIPKSRKVDSYILRPSFQKLKNIFKATLAPFIIATLGLLFVNLARYFVDIYHPNLQGYFGIIIMPFSLVVLLFSFISMPLIINLSNAYNNKDFKTLNTSVIKIFTLMLAVASVLCVFVYFTGAFILRILFDLDFDKYTLDLVLIIAAGFAVSSTALFTNIAVIARKFQFIIIVYLSSTALLAVLCAVLVSHNEIRGAVVAYVIASIFQMLLTGLYFLKISNYKLSRNS